MSPESPVVAGAEAAHEELERGIIDEILTWLFGIRATREDWGGGLACTILGLDLDLSREVPVAATGGTGRLRVWGTGGGFSAADGAPPAEECTM